MTLLPQKNQGQFGQGLFQINPDATPEDIKDRRALLDNISYGNAQYIGEGMTDLFKGMVAGRQRSQMNEIASGGRTGANSTVDRIRTMLSGGTPGPSASTPKFSGSPLFGLKK